MSQTSSLNVNSLFQTAHDEGDLSKASLQMLEIADIGTAISGALGVNVGSVTASGEVLLVGQLVDDSGSIRMAGNSQHVRDGHNLVLDSLGDSKQKNNILACCRYLTGPLLPHGVLYPYGPLDQAVRMTPQNYNPNEGTPLFDQAVVFFGGVLAKTQEFSDNGMIARSCNLIVSDGADQHSRKHKASDVGQLVVDLHKQERHINAAMGIDDAPKACVSCGHDYSKKLATLVVCPKCQATIRRTDFYQVFSGRSMQEVLDAKVAGTIEELESGPDSMCILPKWVLTPGSTPSEIRRAFQLFSQSAVRASQATGKSFSKVAMTGFTK